MRKKENRENKNKLEWMFKTRNKYLESYFSYTFIYKEKKTDQQTNTNKNTATIENKPK